MIPVIDRFLSKVRKTDTCWIFFSIIRTNGYGLFWYKGKNWNAHRASYEIFKGQIPAGKWVLHTCDNPSCVNPDHLYIGDIFQNAKDMVERGRVATGTRHGSKTTNRSYSGENNPFSKLSNENCMAIKKAIDGGVSKVWLASQANVNLSTIYRAKYRADALIAELNKNPTP